MEVHGAYLLHQDFTGAPIPTVPSGLTMWVGQNDCPNWTLRLYPGSNLEDLTFLGSGVALGDVPAQSRSNWVKYVQHIVDGEYDAAQPYLERFTNTHIGVDQPEVYVRKYHGRRLEQERLEEARAQIAAAAR
jgi:hypothetical protein